MANLTTERHPGTVEFLPAMPVRYKSTLYLREQQRECDLKPGPAALHSHMGPLDVASIDLTKILVG